MERENARVGHVSEFLHALTNLLHTRQENQDSAAFRRGRDDMADGRRYELVASVYQIGGWSRDGGSEHTS